MPIYYVNDEEKAYIIDDGGRNGYGEIWLKKENSIQYSFVSSDSPSQEGRFANGFIFDYYAIPDWSKQGNSDAYINCTMTREKSSTTRAVPAHIRPFKKLAK